MSSRALRRLQQEAAVIRVPSSGQEIDEEENELAEGPGFASYSSSKSRKPTANPFAMLVDDGAEGGGNSEEEEHGENSSPILRRVSDGPSSGKKKKKRKKKSKQTNRDDQTKQSQGTGGMEDVDAVIREVNELLGETPLREGATNASSFAAVHKALFSVDKRCLNADNEMRRIFGARVVRAETGRRRSHRRTHHRSTTFLATPKDTWPAMDKPGLSMQLAENKDGCQYFVFEHSQEYQRIQFRFWDAVETFDPEAIVEVLHAHPYHIDSLLQLSEVCKMSEDIQMATELIERALYCFECNLHALFNYSQGNCRLSYSVAENRPFFIALFRHLSYVGRKGCHRTALEFCKLLLGLDPEGDPLCCLLMIDYFALRAGEYTCLLELFNAWESHRNLSQLPNFAFSIPLALFHSSSSTNSGKDGHTSDSPGPSDADSGQRLQDALLMFPSMLLPLVEKCSVNLDPRVVKHSFFADADLSKDPSSLQLLIRLYIERSHSLWKEPEVLTWLEENSRQVVARVDANDIIVADYARKRQKRYIGTPRNIYRHVIMSDFDQVAATLPRDLSDTAIMMYDPLPPLDSTSGYSRPQRRNRTNLLREDENPFLLFLRSLLPTFNHQGDAGRLRDAGDHPNPAIRQLQAQLAAARAQRNHGARQPRGNDEPEVGGAVGGVAPPILEGQPGQPLDLQRPLDQLVDLLVQFLGGRGVDRDGEDSPPLSSDHEDNASSDNDLD